MCFYINLRTIHGKITSSSSLKRALCSKIKYPQPHNKINYDFNTKIVHKILITFKSF